jgi:hypothetical protein
VCARGELFATSHQQHERITAPSVLKKKYAGFGIREWPYRRVSRHELVSNGESCQKIADQTPEAAH